MPPELVEIIGRALRKDPAQRWQSMQEVHAVLAVLRQKFESGILDATQIVLPPPPPVKKKGSALGGRRGSRSALRSPSADGGPSRTGIVRSRGPNRHRWCSSRAPAQIGRQTFAACAPASARQKGRRHPYQRHHSRNGQGPGGRTADRKPNSAPPQRPGSTYRPPRSFVSPKRECRRT